MTSHGRSVGPLAPAPHRASSAAFRARIHAILRSVPTGRIVVYGQLAWLAGRLRAARQVGWSAHAGGPDLPRRRVVNRAGGFASGDGGGRASLTERAARDTGQTRDGPRRRASRRRGPGRPLRSV